MKIRLTRVIDTTLRFRDLETGDVFILLDSAPNKLYLKCTTPDTNNMMGVDLAFGCTYFIGAEAPVRKVFGTFIENASVEESIACAHCFNKIDTNKENYYIKVALDGTVKFYCDDCAASRK